MDAETAARFDAVDRRFDIMLESIAGQFELMQKRTDERFARLIDVLTIRFDQIDQRFTDVDRRFDQIERRLLEERARVAGQFEAQQKHVDMRFDELRESLDLRFNWIDGRLTALEGRD